jgi:hypothetical protein
VVAGPAEEVECPVARGHRLLVPAQPQEGVAEVDQNHALAVRVAQLPVDRRGLLVGTDGLLVLAGAHVRRGQVDEGFDAVGHVAGPP